MGISNFMVRIVGLSLIPCWFPHALRQMFLHLLAALSWLGACLIHIAPGPQWIFSIQPCEWMPVSGSQYRRGAALMGGPGENGDAAGLHECAMCRNAQPF